MPVKRVRAKRPEQSASRTLHSRAQPFQSVGFWRRRARRDRPTPKPEIDVAPQVSSVLLSDLRAAAIQVFERNGIEEPTLAVINGARWILEQSPEMFGVLLANGIRDPGTLSHAARGARDEYETLALDFHKPPSNASARVPARIFVTIAYEQPFFDGNKRTGLLSGTLLAAMLGFDLRDSAYADLEEEVRQFSARNASIEDVADWFLEKVLILPMEETPR